jgi:hypothetical protein
LNNYFIDLGSLSQQLPQQSTDAEVKRCPTNNSVWPV